MDGGFEYQIFDCICFSGTFVGNMDHVKRMEYALRVIESKSSTECFEMMVKSYSTCDQALEMLYESKFPIDGWILVDTKRPYVFGKDEYLYKFKQVHTIDLKVVLYQTARYSENLQVQRENEKKECLVYLATIDNGQFQPIQQLVFTETDKKNLCLSSEHLLVGKVLECVWDQPSNRWKPVKVRRDKDIPNNIVTYNLTVRNIEEQITAKEMYLIFKNMKQDNNNTRAK